MKCKWNSAEAAQTILTMFQENSDMRVIERVQTAFSVPRVIENRLYHCKDGLTATELATQANCSPSRVTAILDRWEEEGFAERFQLEGDRLHTYVRLTEEGAKRAKERQADMLSFVDAVLTRLGSKRTKVAMECLKIALEFTKEQEELPCLD